MFKKVKSTVLIIIFVVLLAIVVIMKMVQSKKGERTFKKDLFSFNIEDATSILINRPSIEENTAELVKEADGWKVKIEGEYFKADEANIESMLKQLNELRAERVAATSESKWVEYKVVDSLATKVMVKKGNSIIADLYMGKFSYKQMDNQMQYYQNPRGGGGTKMTTYIRPADEKNVYAVDGFLNMTFNRKPDLFRDKSIVKCNADDITALHYSYPDSSFVLSKQENQWLAGGMMADSAETVKFLRSLARLNSSNFVNEGEKFKTDNPLYSLRVEGNNLTPIEVKAYPSDSTYQYIVETSINPGAYFDGGKLKIFDKLFVPKSKFIK